jgi:hypothetical protein
MSTDTSQPETPDHDELVAYLDGELGPAECRAIEQRLANDPKFREKLNNLDQAWEALNVLPTSMVDDSFAKTTIELACVAAQEDLTKHTQVLAVARRGRKWQVFACCLVAGVMGFIVNRWVAVRNEHAQLNDLPIIAQLNALSNTPSIEFLRKLSTAVPAPELVGNNKETFDRSLAEFSKANASTLEERRAWIDALPAHEKAELEERSRAFVALRQKPEENGRMRQLLMDISSQPDAAKLQETLVAYGYWLSPAKHTAGELEQLRDDLRKLSVNERVDEISRTVRRENEQASRHLSKEDQVALRAEIIEVAKEQRAKWLEKLPPGEDRKKIPAIDNNDVRPALFILFTALRAEDLNGDTTNRLVSKLSPEAQEHWSNVPRRQDRRWGQLLVWIRESMQSKTTGDDLETFFLSDKLSNDKRQELLNMPRAKMEAELERLYRASQLQFDGRWSSLREFGEWMRGPRNGPPGEGPFDGRPEFGRRRPGSPDEFGPPPDARDHFERGRGPRPDGPRGMGPNDGPPRLRRPPNDRFPPDGQPPDGPPRPREGAPPPPPPDGKTPV